MSPLWAWLAAFCVAYWLGYFTAWLLRRRSK